MQDIPDAGRRRVSQCTEWPGQPLAKMVINAVKAAAKPDNFIDFEVFKHDEVSRLRPDDLPELRDVGLEGSI